MTEVSHEDRTDVSSTRQLITSVVATLVARAISASGTILLAYLVANNIGVPQLGTLSTTMAAVLGISTIARFGCCPRILKHCGKHSTPPDGSGSQIFRDALRFGTLTAGLISCIVIGVALATARTSGIHLWLLLASPALTRSYIYAATLRARRLSHISPLLEFGAINLTTASLLYLHIHLSTGTGLDISTVAQTITAVAYSFALIGSLITRQVASDLYTSQQETSLLGHLAGGVNFLTLEVNQYFSQWGVLLIVGLLASPDDVASFSTVQKVAFLVNFILGVTANATSTEIAELHSSNRSRDANSLRRRSSLLMLSYALPASAILVFLGPNILGGFQLDNATNLLMLRILICTQLVNVVSGFSPVVLKMTGHERELRNITLASLLVLTSGTWALVSIYGIVGATFAFAASIAVKNLCSTLVDPSIHIFARTDNL